MQGSKLNDVTTTAFLKFVMPYFLVLVCIKRHWCISWVGIQNTYTNVAHRNSLLFLSSLLNGSQGPKYTPDDHLEDDEYKTVVKCKGVYFLQRL